MHIPSSKEPVLQIVLPLVNLHLIYITPLLAGEYPHDKNVYLLCSKIKCYSLFFYIKYIYVDKVKNILTNFPQYKANNKI